MTMGGHLTPPTYICNRFATRADALPFVRAPITELAGLKRVCRAGYTVVGSALRTKGILPTVGRTLLEHGQATDCRLHHEDFRASRPQWFALLT